jgi:hypothetical protein
MGVGTAGGSVFWLFLFFYPGRGDTQQLLRQPQGFPLFLMFCSPVDDFFFDGHTVRISERLHPNSFTSVRAHM